MSKKSSQPSVFVFVFFALVVLSIRLLGLGEKPVHHDETINGWFVMQMWGQGFFKYDPANYHGPLLFYLFQWTEPLLGSSIEAMRGLTSFFSFLTVLMFLYFGFIQRQSAFLIGAAILALSPAAEFFGRSAIHESPFVFFMALTLFAFMLKNQVVPLLAAGLVGMILLKETWVLWVLSWAVALVMSRAWKLTSLQEFLEQVRDQRNTRKRLLGLAGFCMAVVALFYSGFFQNPTGILNFFAAFLPWTKTGVAGAGHEKPWFTWLNWFWQFETPTLVMLVLTTGGVFLRFRGHEERQVSRQVQFYCWLALVHFLLYSLIPYKTPWCLISIQLPLVFSGTLVLQEFFNSKFISHHHAWQRLIMGSLSALGLIHWEQMRVLVWASPIQMEHPYVYVQTQYDVKKLIQHLKKEEVFLSQEKIQIATTETWPFPWLLRQYPKLNYAAPKAQPDIEAAVILFDEAEAERVRPLLKTTHWERLIQVRQSRAPAVVFLRNDLVQKVGPF